MIRTGQMSMNYTNNIGNSLRYNISLISNSDFLSRVIGMDNPYDDIMLIVKALGREPVSLLGKDYLFIFDHVKRNYDAGTDIISYEYFCPKFTFYKERPSIRFADPYNDTKLLLGRWMPDVVFEPTSYRDILFSYAESDDDSFNGRDIGTRYDMDSANPGVNMGGISSFANTLNTCDIISKTNTNFKNGRYRTLVARFHTNSLDSMDKGDITQTAISEMYGMSHGRNLLSKKNIGHIDNGYDNPYCRVWTYHHQYNQLARAIRPFDTPTAEMLEKEELSGQYSTVGFRTVGNEDFGVEGGSKRLDKYGSLNYRNGLVNIAPTAKIKDYFEHKEDKEITIKKCMFSIENLAWKSENIIKDEYDQYGLSAEQKGPLGGRIMWFPPYDLTFSEDVSVNWNPNQFIGRGEKVYTYTDTERRGNLSFMLLIDHPSIIDYWTGHNRNGQKNKDISLLDGNAGGVDMVDNQENTLLRFFAGCDILTAKPQEYKTRERKKENKPQQTTVIETPPEPEVHDPVITKKRMHCVLYYPNNYSGVNDFPTNSSDDIKVNAIYYLMNGVGTQKTTTEAGWKENPIDIPTTIDSKVSCRVGSTKIDGIGGYEIGEYGISYFEKFLNPEIEVIEKTRYRYHDKCKAELLTDETGEKDLDCTYSGKSYSPVVKIIGSKALPISIANNTTLKKLPYDWYRRRCYHRVDEKVPKATEKNNSYNVKKDGYTNNAITDRISYIDTTSYKLNGTGYEKVLDNTQIKQAFGIKDEDILISFADLFVGLEGEKAANIIGEGNYSENNARIVKAIKEDNGEKYNITKITFKGHASTQGYTARNHDLGINRANTLKFWMEKNGFPKINDNITTVEAPTPQSAKGIPNMGNDNELTTKIWRSASVIIEYEESDVIGASTAEEITVDSEGNNNIDRLEIPNSTQSNPIKTPNVSNTATNNGTNWLSTYQSNQMFNLLNNPISYNFTSNGPIANTEKTRLVERYDNEGEFFELLKENDPFMHHLITDKIKYFDPAYHSVSPEGFNARLTFLHQCTRQGSTVGSSDELPATAYNLAFGRPPVCVLRIGDFYNTKIIINSVSINYETPQWDLNPEGIGVMPMFAKVSINFVFLGGSDLAGPISRLQNAVSFNYYANTSVYDNRAEEVQYDPNGKGDVVKFKAFSYPDMVQNGGPRKKLKPIIEIGDFGGEFENTNNTFTQSFEDNINIIN